MGYTHGCNLFTTLNMNSALSLGLSNPGRNPRVIYIECTTSKISNCFLTKYSDVMVAPAMPKDNRDICTVGLVIQRYRFFFTKSWS